MVIKRDPVGSPLYAVWQLKKIKMYHLSAALTQNTTVCYLKDAVLTVLKIKKRQQSEMEGKKEINYYLKMYVL